MIELYEAFKKIESESEFQKLVADLCGSEKLRYLNCRFGKSRKCGITIKFNRGKLKVKTTGIVKLSQEQQTAA